MTTPNLKYIRELSGGDSEFELKLITVLKKELPGEKSKYEIFFTTENWVGAAEMTHKIKHKTMVLNMPQSFAKAEKHEDMLRNGNTELHHAFIAIIEKMTTFLSQF